MQFLRYQTQPGYTSGVSYADLLEGVDRLFQTTFPVLPGRAFPVDLYEDKESFIVRAEVPGFRKEELGVEVADGMLTITAESKPAQEGAETRRLSRSLTLPEEVAPDQIGARYENGVLTLTLPRREETKPKQITVEVK